MSTEHQLLSKIISFIFPKFKLGLDEIAADFRKNGVNSELKGAIMDVRDAFVKLVSRKAKLQKLGEDSQSENAKDKAQSAASSLFAQAEKDVKKHGKSGTRSNGRESDSSIPNDEESDEESDVEFHPDFVEAIESVIRNTRETASSVRFPVPVICDYRLDSNTETKVAV